jgi:hypothetical protein
VLAIATKLSNEGKKKKKKKKELRSLIFQEGTAVCEAS